APVRGPDRDLDRAREAGDAASLHPSARRRGGRRIARLEGGDRTRAPALDGAFGEAGARVVAAQGNLGERAGDKRAHAALARHADVDAGGAGRTDDAVSELAPVIETPARDAAVGEPRAGVRDAGRDLYGACDACDRHRSRAPAPGTVAER